MMNPIVRSGMADSQSLPERTDAVIIGAGCVGCSIAYHLAERGRTDVAVLDMGPIPETGGSTSHAPGGLIQTTSSETMTRFASYTRDLFDELDAYHRVGSVSTAKTEDRMDALRRDRDYAASWGLDDTELLTPEEVTDHLPLVDPGAIIGGYYVPHDGVIDSLKATEWMAEAAADKGVTLHPHTKVVDVELAGNGVWSIVTEGGRMEAENVVIATNIWAPTLAKAVGVDVPLVPCEHQYALTEPVPDLNGVTSEVERPLIRHQDGGVYLRQHWDAYGIGNYNHDPLVADPANLPDYDDAPHIPNVQNYDQSRSFNGGDPPRMPASRRFTEEHFTDAWDEVTELLPALGDVEIAGAFNGMFAFTPDGFPILGEPPATDRLWLATAVHVTHSGGVGRVMAELLEGVPPSVDLRECEVARFRDHERSPQFARERGGEVYEHFWDIHTPSGSSGQMRKMRRSPFFRHQADLNAAFHEVAGWERPRLFQSNADLAAAYDVGELPLSGWESDRGSPIAGAEQLAVRNGVGLYDLSHETVLRVSGRGTLDVLQYAFASDLDTPVGSLTYAPALTDAGGIAGTAFVVRTATDEFLVLAGPGPTGSILERRLHDRAPADDAVQIENETSGWCGVGVWGPDAGGLIGYVTAADLSDEAVPPGTATDSYVGGVPTLLVRVSRVGSDGWELYAPAEYGGKLWETLRGTDGDYDVRPIGDRAFEGLRLEAGYRRWGRDFSTEHAPDEARLSLTVDPQKGSFIGRNALADERGTDRTLSCLTVDAPEATVMEKMPVLRGDEVIGSVTSADWCYPTDAGVAYGYLPTDVAAGSRLTIRYADDPYEATVRDGPLLDERSGPEHLAWKGR